MLALASTFADPGIPTVVLMGLGTVFVGILTIIIVCKLISLFDRRKKVREPDKTEEYVKPDGELAAVLGAVIAEETGADVKNIKIVSVKKV